MRSFRYPRAAIVAVALLATAIFAFALFRPSQIAQAGTTIELQSPMQQADVLPDVTLTLEAIQNEAGIAAWFNAGQSINLATLAPQYRTIELQNANYIIGSVAVLDYDEVHDVHVYVHKDGWLMAYYLKTDPVAKIVDIVNYPTEGLRTKFEVVLQNLASTAGVPFLSPSYWDFRYPNANRIMLVGEDRENGTDFTIKLPQAYTFFERSWTGKFGYELNLDDVEIGRSCNSCTATIPASQMPTEVTHRFWVADWSENRMALALIYRAP